MEEIFCSLCGKELNDGAAAYGLTNGSINEACFGFRVDEDSCWDVYCPSCMTEIDKLIANIRKGNE